jgi:hypothetical protein
MEKEQRAGSGRDRVRVGGTDSLGVDGQINAVTSEEQAQDQLNVKQGRPIASVQKHEIE